MARPEVRDVHRHRHGHGAPTPLSVSVAASLPVRHIGRTDRAYLLDKDTHDVIDTDVDTPARVSGREHASVVEEILFPVAVAYFLSNL